MQADSQPLDPRSSPTTATEGWRAEWAPIFRAAAEQRFPNRVLGVMEMAECIRQLRRSRVIPNSHPR
jgi:hypothetical protein